MLLLLVMLGVSLVVILVVFLFTRRPVYNDDTIKLMVLNEYLKLSGAEDPEPERLSYVSDINNDIYRLVTFDTETRETIEVADYDMKIKIFDFYLQKFYDGSDGEFRLRANPDDASKYQIKTDTGWAEMTCPQYTKFEGGLCVNIPWCESKEEGDYPLTKEAIDFLIFRGHRTLENSQASHPSLYLHCDGEENLTLKECDPNYTFEGNECQLKEICKEKEDGYIIGDRPSYLNNSEYEVCKGGVAEIKRCPENQIWSETQCVAAHPCRLNPPGFQFIDLEKPNEFYTCINDTQWQTIRCLKVIERDGEYQCSGDYKCEEFENGSGSSMIEVEGEHLKYNLGIIECMDYSVTREEECETEMKDYNNVNGIFNLKIERPLFEYRDGGCLPFALNADKIVKGFYNISCENEYGLDCGTSAVGGTIGLDLAINQYPRSFIFAKNKVAINDQAEEVDCIGSTSPLVNPFFINAINFCDEEGNLERTEIIGEDEYYHAKTQTIRPFNNDFPKCGKWDPMTNYITQIDSEITLTTNCMELLGTEPLETYNSTSCFLSLSTFNMVECFAETIEPTFIDPGCEHMDGVKNIINLKIFDPEITCQVVVEEGDINIIKIDEEAPEDYDYNTQSIDGILKMPFIKLDDENKWMSAGNNNSLMKILKGNFQD